MVSTGARALYFAALLAAAAVAAQSTPTHYFAFDRSVSDKYTGCSFGTPSTPYPDGVRNTSVSVSSYQYATSCGADIQSGASGSMSFWVNFPTAPITPALHTDSPLMLVTSTTTPTPGGRGFTIRMQNASGNVLLSFGPNGAQQANATLVVKQWYHIAVTFTFVSSPGTGVFVLYVNGAVQGNTTAQFDNKVSDYIVFFPTVYTSYSPSPVYVDELRTYAGHALSPSEVNNLYTDWCTDAGHFRPQTQLNMTTFTSCHEFECPKGSIDNDSDYTTECVYCPFMPPGSNGTCPGYCTTDLQSHIVTRTPTLTASFVDAAHNATFVFVNVTLPDTNPRRRNATMNFANEGWISIPDSGMCTWEYLRTIDLATYAPSHCKKVVHWGTDTINYTCGVELMWMENTSMQSGDERRRGDEEYNLGDTTLWRNVSAFLKFHVAVKRHVNITTHIETFGNYTLWAWIDKLAYVESTTTKDHVVANLTLYVRVPVRAVATGVHVSDHSIANADVLARVNASGPNAMRGDEIWTIGIELGDTPCSFFGADGDGAWIQIMYNLSFGYTVAEQIMTISLKNTEQVCNWDLTQKVSAEPTVYPSATQNFTRALDGVGQELIIYGTPFFAGIAANLPFTFDNMTLLPEWIRIYGSALDPDQVADRAFPEDPMGNDDTRKHLYIFNDLEFMNNSEDLVRHDYWNYSVIPCPTWNPDVHLDFCFTFMLTRPTFMNGQRWFVLETQFHMDSLYVNGQEFTPDTRKRAERTTETYRATRTILLGTEENVVSIAPLSPKSAPVQQEEQKIVNVAHSASFGMYVAVICAAVATGSIVAVVALAAVQRLRQGRVSL